MTSSQGYSLLVSVDVSITVQDDLLQNGRQVPVNAFEQDLGVLPCCYSMNCYRIASRGLPGLRRASLLLHNDLLQDSGQRLTIA